MPDTEKRTYDLSDADFIAHLAELNGTPREVLLDTELMRVLLPQLRADFELVQTRPRKRGRGRRIRIQETCNGSSTGSA